MPRYTGEDGFECSIPADALEKLAEKFTSHGDVWLGGLGARDALRLEAGLCLYGDIYASSRDALLVSGTCDRE